MAYVTVGRENSGDIQVYVLAGCGCGTGDLTRYLGAYGQRRVRAAALLAPLPPFLPRSPANPDGADQGLLDDFLAQLDADRPAAVKAYIDRYYNIDLLGGIMVTDQAWQNSFHVAIGVSAAAAAGCALAWREDFRPRCHDPLDQLLPLFQGAPGADLPGDPGDLVVWLAGAVGDAGR